MVNIKNLRKHGFNTDNRTFVIAEIGINHNGSMKQAEELIRIASDTGADAVKFQTYITEKRTKKDSPIFDILKSCELSNDNFKELKQYSDECGIEFFSTPFDEESVDFLESINCNLYKIASFDVTNLKLIDKIAQTFKPIIMSTGMATFNEIQRAVSVISEHRTSLNNKTKIALLHCISAYPTLEKDANLSAMLIMNEQFKQCVIGQSDHTDDIMVPLYAVTAGAQIVEKHFMLRGIDCPDNPVSIDQFQMTKFVEEIRRIEAIFGNGSFGIAESEKGAVQHRRNTDLN